MNGRRLWMIPLMWVLTVAGASTLTWTVIAAAGTRVSQPVSVVAPTAADTTGPQSGQATRTWTGQAGRLTASCSGSSISLGTAVPSVGYWVKVHERGPANLWVDFESTDPDDRSEVRLGTACQNGSPVFKRL